MPQLRERSRLASCVLLACRFIYSPIVPVPLWTRSSYFQDRPGYYKDRELVCFSQRVRSSQSPTPAAFNILHLISDPSLGLSRSQISFVTTAFSRILVTTSDDVAQTKFQTTTIMASTAEGPSQLPASAFSFTAPFPPPPSSVSSVSQSSLKQRRVSLALPSSPRLFNAWTFRDDTGVGAHSPDTSLAPEKKGKMRRIDSTERTEAENSPSSSQSQSEKKPRKKWTMEETNMLVAGCNKVRISLFK